MGFPDSAWELSMLTMLITLNFHMDTTFTLHLDTCLQETGLNHTDTFLNEVTVGNHNLRETSHDA